MADWPVSLPDYIMQSSFIEKLSNNNIRSQMDVGPAKLRRRATAIAQPVRGEVYMTTAQIATHDGFYKATLEYGSLPFNWTHPRTGAATTFRYVTPPTYKSLGQKWIVSLNLEMLP